METRKALHYMQVIVKAKEFMKETFKDFTDGHDPSHMIRVYDTALRIATEYRGCDVFTISIGSLLHHIDDDELFENVGEDYPTLRKFLADNEVDQADIEKIVKLVETYDEDDDEPKDLETSIVHDADHLDAIGAIGIARCFAFGSANGNSIPKSSERFFDKLLTFKDGMLTEYGKKESEYRQVQMIKFLKGFNAQTRKE